MKNRILTRPWVSVFLFVVLLGIWEMPMNLNGAEIDSKPWELAIIAAGDGFEIRTGELTMELAGEKDGLHISGINPAWPKDKNYLSHDAVQKVLWRVYLKNSKGEEMVLGSAGNVCKPVIKATDTGEKSLNLFWQKVGKLNVDVKVSIRVQPDSPLVYMNIDVRNNSEMKLQRVEFPVIEGLGPFGETSAEDNLIWPRTTGRLISNPYENGIPGGYWESFPYPSASQSMQFSGIYGQWGGLYVAAYDSDCNIKRLQFEKTPANESLEYFLINYPGNIDKAGNDYRMPYDAVIGVFNGDWWSAAELYRKWALNQPWCRQSTVLKDISVSESFKNIAMWVNLWGDPGGWHFGRYDQLDKYFDVKTCGHWYGWCEAEFDTLYPEFFPARESFKKTVKQLQHEEMIIMPYINARLWDTNAKSFGANVENAAVQRENGDAALEKYNYRDFAVMCPSSEFWQDKIASICKRLVDEYDVGAIYLDQLSACGVPLLCHGGSHPHAAGGGDYWTKGHWRMLDKIRDSIKGKDVFLTSESFTECYISRIEGFLPWIAFGDGNIPLAQAIYSGRTAFWGHYFDRGDLEGNAFKVKLAGMLANGVQPGWFHHWLMDENAQKQRAYARDMVKLYDAALRSDAFLDGQFVKPPVLTGVDGMVFSDLTRSGGTKTRVEYPAVIISAWRLSDGNYRLLLINLSDKAQNVSLDLKKWNETAGKILPESLRLQTSKDRGVQKINGADGVYTVTLQADEAGVLFCEF